MTREEAAEALYRAAKAYKDCRVDDPLLCKLADEFKEAVDAYPEACATPSPLPAEVARVLEAAGKFTATFGHALRAGSYGAEGELLALAVTAYRSSQPEPLSARLAGLKPGAEVRCFAGVSYTVLMNLPQYESLVGVSDGEVLAFNYADINSILSEVS